MTSQLAFFNDDGNVTGYDCNDDCNGNNDLLLILMPINKCLKVMIDN